jgi:hypothetical protein
MISLAHNFLFIHLPKTAGNSVQNILLPYSDDHVHLAHARQDGVERFEIRNSRYPQHRKHATYQHYKNFMEPEVFEGLYKFATIRNPWDRCVSFYFSPHRGVSAFDPDAFERLIVGQIRTVRQFTCPRTYLERAMDRAGKPWLLERFRRDAIDQHIDFMMRFEHLEADLNHILQHLGLPEQSLPHRNQGKREHYSTYYTPRTRKLVAEKFAEEIEWGQYTFEG